MSKPQKILIVEDESPLANAVDLKLTSAGFSVTRADDGAKAVEIVTVTDFDVILLDLLLPNMDGFEVLEKVKQIKPYIKVIITSNLSQDEDKQRAKNLGADDYLVKSDIQLVDIVNYLNDLDVTPVGGAATPAPSAAQLEIVPKAAELAAPINAESEDLTEPANADQEIAA
jgi:CheY-like chemotaxis protein